MFMPCAIYIHFEYDIWFINELYCAARESYIILTVDRIYIYFTS